jgi:uncharacterized protein YacL
MLVRKLSDQREVFEQIISSPNFLLILIGALIWYLGTYALLLAPLVTVAGFGLTIIATAQAAMSRPISSALPGLLIGGLIYVIGPFIAFIPFVGWILGPMVVVSGSVMLLFYGFSIALQRIDIPVVKNLEDFLEAQQRKRKEPEPEPEIVDVEEIVDEPSDEETDVPDQ